MTYLRGCSSVGRAVALQATGQGFDPPLLHHLRRVGRTVMHLSSKEAYVGSTPMPCTISVRNNNKQRHNMIGIKSRKSLETILSSFTKTLNDLEALQSANAKEVAENEVKLSALRLENHELNEEGNQAAKVHAKLTELVS